MKKTILTFAFLLYLACTIAKAETLAGLTPPGAALAQPPDQGATGTTTTTVIASTTGNQKIAVLITDWGTPSRYVFEYSWYNHYWARVGDLTDNGTAACKIGHVGKPYIDPATGQTVNQGSHLGLLPYALSWEYPGKEYLYDRPAFTSSKTASISQ